MNSEYFKTNVYYKMSEKEKDKLFEKTRIYKEIFIKNKIKNCYSEMNYIIAEQKMISFGYESSQMIEAVYYSKKRTSYNIKLEYSNLILYSI